MWDAEVWRYGKGPIREYSEADTLSSKREEREEKRREREREERREEERRVERGKE